MKKLFIVKKQPLHFTVISTTICLVTLGLRIQITGEVYGLFLVWNLFLAFIPLGIVWFMQLYQSLFERSLWRYSFAGLWILFLPNAPYVITDLIHLSYSSSDWFFYDAFLILVFAGISLYFGFLSIFEMRHLFKNQLSTLTLNIITGLTLFLCSFGIYLGRVIRFNSWDLIINPLEVLQTISQFLLYPFLYRWVWVFTIGLGLVLNVAYFRFQTIFNSKYLYDHSR